MNDEAQGLLSELTDALDTILACLEGLDSAGLNWTPPIANANSLYVIAKHSLANAERNVMAAFCGEPYDYRRAEEFAAKGESEAALQAHWRSLRARFEAGIEAAGPGRPDELCDHARLGRIPGRQVLLRAVAHAAEHAGEAALTRRWLG